MSSSPDFDDEHATAHSETGFWGRRAAGCLVYCRETDRLLIQKRSSIVLEPNTWGTWGGAVDPGETPVETVYRELREEGVETELLTKAIPVFVFTHESGFSYHNFIVVTEEEFEPVLTWEAADFRWINPDEIASLPDELHPGLMAMLESPVTRNALNDLRQACGGRHFDYSEGPR
jgi:8-oxo-dGTP pyrophosphatase MutT (NUDIX family)